MKEKRITFILQILFQFNGIRQKKDGELFKLYFFPSWNWNYFQNYTKLIFEVYYLTTDKFYN